MEPTRFEEMRPGCYDVDARVRDMDINGVWASVNFPSQITGFCGSVFSRCSDPGARARGDEGVERLVLRGVALARTPSASCRWASRSSPTRSSRPRRSGATRRAGFTAVTLPEQPHRIGMEPIFSDWWEPILAACAETDTVVCLHVGSSGVVDFPAGAPVKELPATLFGQLALTSCAEWLWSKCCVRHPEPADRDERGRDRLGRDAARPAREPRRPLGLRPELRART